MVSVEQVRRIGNVVMGRNGAVEERLASRQAAMESPRILRGHYAFHTLVTTPDPGI